MSWKYYAGAANRRKKNRIRKHVERKIGKSYVTLEEKEARKAAILKAKFK